MESLVSAHVQDAASRAELGLLAVLEALAEDERVSQRQLAQRTGLNLKKVNYCLHELLGRGYVKFRRAVRQADKRAYLYVLTPAGLAAKSQLTYRFVRSALGYYNQVEARFARCLGQMAAAGVRQVVLCGPTAAARIVLGLGAQDGLQIVGVVGEHAEGEVFHGVPVLGPTQVPAGAGVLITALEPEAASRWVEGLGVSAARIWRLS